MMKTKWTTYLLIIVVIIVWGIIIIKLFLHSESHGISQTQSTIVRGEFPHEMAESLLMNYPDPFLKKEESKGKIVRLHQPVQKVTSKRNIDQKNIQAIHLGCISAVGKQLHIISLQGVQYELQCGDTVAGFHFFKCDSDSLYLEKEHVLYGVKLCE